jgi:hypothetical protein
MGQIKILAVISLLLSLIFLFSCTENTPVKKNPNIEIVYEKIYGVNTGLYMCFTKTKDMDEMRSYGTQLVENYKVAFVFFYDNKNKIRDIRNYKHLDDALPDDGYIARLDKSPGFGIEFEKK